MSSSSVRILVVEDFEGWRAFVISELQKRHNLQIVGQAADGSEALHKVDELHPDLILMDIGIPVLNGLEVARRINSTNSSKILFLSENRSPEVVQEALRAGARGYVVKSDAARDLVQAVEAVMHGNMFLSACLADATLYSNEPVQH